MRSISMCPRCGVKHMGTCEKPILKRMNKRMNKCCICGDFYTGHGNNPAPVKETGLCCDDCNNWVVIPARVKRIGEYMKWEPKT